MQKEAGVVGEALLQPGLAPQIGNLLAQSEYAHRVLRYELYDQQGGLSFTSGKAGLDLGPTLPDLSTQQHPGIALHQGPGGKGPTNFALLSLPRSLNGQPGGTLVVYLDQSEQAKVLSNYFGVIAAIILVLLGVGVATPVAIAWMKSRERRRAEEQVRYLENHDAVTGLSNRAAFSNRLADAMSRMHRDGTHIAVPLPRHRQVQGDQRRR